MKYPTENFKTEWNTNALRVGYSRLFDVKFSMFRGVCEQSKVFNSIVQLISIQMMNMFRGFKFPPQIFFHNNTVFKFMTQNLVSLRRNTPTFPMRSFFTNKVWGWRKGFSFIKSREKLVSTIFGTKESLSISIFGSSSFLKRIFTKFTLKIMPHNRPTHTYIILRLWGENNI